MIRRTPIRFWGLGLDSMNIEACECPEQENFFPECGTPKFVGLCSVEQSERS